MIARRAVVPLAVVLAGCAPPRFYVGAAEFPDLRRGGDRILHLEGDRTIRDTGVFIFERGTRASPAVFVRSLVVGEQGVCLPTRYPAAELWQALRLEGIDPRIAGHVLLPRDVLRIVHIADRTWEIRGSSPALRAWLLDHRRAFEDVHRSFIDLPEITYAAGTSAGWTSSDPEALVKLARAADSPDEDVPPTLVGWRWSDFDRITYYEAWADNLDQAVAESDDDVRRAISFGAGLPPGPCPLRDGGRPLLRGRASASAGT